MATIQPLEIKIEEDIEKKVDDLEQLIGQVLEKKVGDQYADDEWIEQQESDDFGSFQQN